MRNFPIFSYTECRNQLQKKETELQSQLDECCNEIAACYTLMDQIRTERASQLEALRQKVEDLEREEEQRRNSVTVMTAKLETLNKNLVDLVVRRLTVGIAVNLMTPAKSSVVKNEVPEHVQPTLRQFQTELRILEEEIQFVREEEERLIGSVKESNETVASIGPQLANAKLEFNKATYNVDPSYSDLMGQLMDEQKNRSQTCCALKKQLADLEEKMNFLRLDEYNFGLN